MTGHALASAFTDPPGPGATLAVHFDDGTTQQQDVARWLAEADPIDTTVLDRCTGPTVDLGCGPGRLVAALSRRGVPVLGIDLSRRAVALTRARGGLALRRDVFASLPGEGRWSHGLLMDGNIGIGGDPVRLLRRVAALLSQRGHLLVEVCGEDVDRRGQARLQRPDGTLSGAFPWAALGAPALARVGAGTGWWPTDRWVDGHRAFVDLRRR